MRKYGKTYDELMDTGIQIQESKNSDNLINALGDCIDAAPERAKNKLAQVFEDYQEKFGDDVEVVSGGQLKGAV